MGRNKKYGFGKRKHRFVNSNPQIEILDVSDIMDDYGNFILDVQSNSNNWSTLDEISEQDSSPLSTFAQKESQQVEGL